MSTPGAYLSQMNDSQLAGTREYLMNNQPQSAAIPDYQLAQDVNSPGNETMSMLSSMGGSAVRGALTGGLLRGIFGLVTGREHGWGGLLATMAGSGAAAALGNFANHGEQSGTQDMMTGALSSLGMQALSGNGNVGPMMALAGMFMPMIMMALGNWMGDVVGKVSTPGAPGLTAQMPGVPAPTG